MTDSGTEVVYDPVDKPGVSNLLEILGAATGQSPAEVAKGYTQYGPLKADAGDAVIELLTPIQARYRELLDDRGELQSLLRTGSAKARKIASATLERAYDAVGFVQGLNSTEMMASLALLARRAELCLAARRSA